MRDLMLVAEASLESVFRGSDGGSMIGSWDDLGGLPSESVLGLRWGSLWRVFLMGISLRSRVILLYLRWCIFSY